MNPLCYILGIPLGSALLLAVIRSYKASARLNVLASLGTFIASLFLVTGRPETSTFFMVDDLSAYLMILTAFVGLTTSFFSVRYIGHAIEIGDLKPHFMRYYHAMYQAFLFTMLLALCSNNLGVMWVAVEGATLTTVMLVGLYRTPAALEAAWKYFILCSVGIALGFFGTALLYLAAGSVIGSGLPAMTWSVLAEHASEFPPALLSLAFIFLLVGYGTKAGLAPMHAWLPDAHGEGPTPISALLSGLLLNVAFYAILRFKILLSGNVKVLQPGNLLVIVGLLSLLLSGFMLYRRRDIKRLFAYSSIEHMGIVAFAFGLGGPIANFAGLLHMGMHSLTKSAIFYSVGGVSMAKGTRDISRISGLTASHPLLGWVLIAGMVAIIGMPPFGIFTSEFLLVTSTFAGRPWLALLLCLGLLVAFGALIMRLQDVAFGAPSETKHEERVGMAIMLPSIVHLMLVLAAGIYLPPLLTGWFQNVARLLG